MDPRSNCPSLALLNLHRSRGLAPQDEASLEAHLRRCDACQQRLADAAASDHTTFPLPDSGSKTEVARSSGDAPAVRSTPSRERPAAPPSPHGSSSLTALGLLTLGMLLPLLMQGRPAAPPSPRPAPAPLPVEPIPIPASLPLNPLDAPALVGGPSDSEVEARLVALDAQTREVLEPGPELSAAWAALLDSARGLHLEPYIRGRVEELRRRRHAVATEALAEVNHALVFGAWETFDWERGAALLAEGELAVRDIFPEELALLRDKQRALEARYGAPRFARSFATVGGEWQLRGMRVLTEEEVTREGQATILPGRGRRLELRFDIDEPPPFARLSATLACGMLYEGYAARCDIILNGVVIAGRWTPLSFHWARYEWPITELLVAGENRLVIRLHEEAWHTLWIRQVCVAGSARGE